MTWSYHIVRSLGPRARRGWTLSLPLLGFLFGCAGQLRAQWLDLRVPPPPSFDSATVAAGRGVYEAHCWYCHGSEGDGRGPIAEYLWPRPRDFVEALYRLRTTESGALPTDQDLYRTVSRGMPGTAMPAWGEALTATERWQVVAYVKTFAADLFDDPVFDPYSSVVPIGRPPRLSADSLVAWGRRVYEEAECYECHGLAGRGEGLRADSLQDARGLLILPTNLGLGGVYRGGSTVQDIYLRLTTGMDGTPMPAQDQTLTEEERWAVAAYVRRLHDEEVREVVRSPVITARAAEGSLPASPEDDAWDDAPVSVIALTGQATFAPRWQIPAVPQLEVKALFDERDIALHVRWYDRFADTLPVSEPTAAGWVADDTYPRLFVERDPLPGYPDELEVMFPARHEGGARLPHFVYGDSIAEARVWIWRADAPRDATGSSHLTVVRARGGHGMPEPEAAESLGRGTGIWADGRWSAVLRIPISELPATARAQRGRYAPITFHVREGRTGEIGLRMAVSSWHILYLSEPVRPANVTVVVLVAAGVLLAQVLVVAVMRRKAHRGELVRFGLSPGELAGARLTDPEA